MRITLRNKLIDTAIFSTVRTITKFISFMWIVNSISLFSQEEIKWFKQDLGINKDLWSVFFHDSLNGWIAGNQIILRTTDGGLNWSATNTDNAWRDIYFLSDSIGFVGGENKILKSFDGGQTWEEKFRNNYEWIHNISFLNQSNGLAAGEYNVLLKTSDSGETWIRANLPIIAQVLLDIYIINDSLAWVCGLENIGGPIRGLILNSTDGGENWNINLQSINNDLFYGIHFFDASFGVCLSNNSFYTTNNSGTNWSIRSSLPHETKSLHVLADSSIWVGGIKGGLYKSTDFGVSWLSTFSDSNQTIKDIFFVNEELGWAVGKGGLLLTTKETLNSIEIQSLLPTGFYLYQNYPNPFNPRTKIKYQVSNPVKVKLQVFDLLGCELVTFINEEKPTGYYEVEFNGDKYSSGVYFYKLQAGSFVSTKKMLFLR